MKPTTCILVIGVALYAAVEVGWKRNQPLLDLVMPVLSPGAAESPVDPAELDRAAREFRLQLSETFRDQPAELERRQTVWRAVLTSWQASGARAEDAALVVQWLEAATEASRSDAVGPLPATPVFRVSGAAY